MSTSILESALQTCRVPDWRPDQREICEAVLAGRDVLAVEPTGFGKSLTYQLPAVCSEGLTIIVSPLVALMQNQVQALGMLGIEARAVVAPRGDRQTSLALREAEAGKLRILYVSPERFSGWTCYRLADSVRVRCLVIDEAHCVWQWGAEFRPAYYELGNVRDILRCPVYACTATAAEDTKAAIMSILHMRSPDVFIGPVDRPNLRYEVVEKAEGPDRKDVDRQIAEYVRSHEGPGIVYCATRQSAEWTASVLNDVGIPSGVYHAGLPAKVREKTQEDWIFETKRCMVATIAFGLGIDKGNVRWILHADPPANVEGYCQETGRAGRDGAPATCRLLYSEGDFERMLGLSRHLSNETYRLYRAKQIQDLQSLLINPANKGICRHAAIASYFGQGHGGECGACDVCKP